MIVYILKRYIVEIDIHQHQNSSYLWDGSEKEWGVGS